MQDRSLGAIVFDPSLHRDVVIRRRDGIMSYQLAVVVDDALQGVTDVVRGADLLPSTAWQLALQHALELPRLRYLHLPVLTEKDGPVDLNVEAVDGSVTVPRSVSSF